jgi:BASS family bile acid:Na+ symporter
MEDGTVFTDVLLPLGVAMIMLILGLSLTVADFRRVVVAPRGVAIGMVNLLLVSPLLAFAVAELFDLDPLLAVGLVLLGASPGGAMANLLTHLARGETALSVSMTAISSVLAVVTVPLYLGLAFDHFGASEEDVAVLGTVAKVFAITILPLSIGMRLRAVRPQRTAEIEPRAKRVALVLLVTVIISAIASEWDRLTDSFADVAPAALALNLAAMTISFTVARLARLNYRQATAISMELGVHNATVAIAVATTINTELAIPGAVYGVFMFFTAGAFARLMYRRNSASERTASASAAIAMGSAGPSS